MVFSQQRSSNISCTHYKAIVCLEGAECGPTQTLGVRMGEREGGGRERERKEGLPSPDAAVVVCLYPEAFCYGPHTENI